MKLILRDYLASLRERDELDVLIPDLLSQMGLNVFSIPGVGVRQYGVDVAAFGSIDGGDEKVYLFSIKAGDIGRKDWDGGSVQDLVPSLNEIRSVYIPTHLPSEYKGYPIEICICCGGVIKQNVLLNVTSYTKGYTTETRTYPIWNGELLAGYIEKYFLHERLMLDTGSSLLRKSLAMFEEPDISYKYFHQLVKQFSNQELDDPKKAFITLTQIYICLGILYEWCKEGNNLESAYLCGEISLLHTWNISKAFLEKNSKGAKAIKRTLVATQMLYMKICSCYLDTKIIPNVNKPYALSSAVKSSCSVDVNLKLFDVLGRLAISGIWAYWILSRIDNNEENKEKIKQAAEVISLYQVAIKGLIKNNPILFTPYKDDQAIDIALAILFLAHNDRNTQDLYNWLFTMVDMIHRLFQSNGKYPSNIQDYHELLEHPSNGGGDAKAHLEKVTVGSVLYPMIGAVSALFGFDNIYSGIQGIKSNFLPHSNFQVWFPCKSSEEFFYSNNSPHGATLSHVGIRNSKSEFIDELLAECSASTYLNDLSAIKFQYWPIILIACRHYRLPIPVHFFPILSSIGKEESAEQ